MKLLSKILITTLLLAFVNHASAKDLKVKTTYGDMEGPYEDYKVMKSMEFTYEGAEYLLERKDKSCKSYVLTSDNHEVGGMLLQETENGYQWVLTWNNTSVEIAFGDDNDPRELKLSYEGKHWWMQNLEPDCNSVFALFANKENLEKDEAKPIATALAKQACGESKWKIALNNGIDIPAPVLVSHICVSALAITVRAIYASDK